MSLHEKKVGSNFSHVHVLDGLFSMFAVSEGDITEMGCSLLISTIDFRAGDFSKLAEHFLQGIVSNINGEPPNENVVEVLAFFNSFSLGDHFGNFDLLPA